MYGAECQQFFNNLNRQRRNALVIVESIPRRHKFALRHDNGTQWGQGVIYRQITQKWSKLSNPCARCRLTKIQKPKSKETWEGLFLDTRSTQKIRRAHCGWKEFSRLLRTTRNKLTTFKAWILFVGPCWSTAVRQWRSGFLWLWLRTAPCEIFLLQNYQGSTSTVRWSSGWFQFICRIFMTTSGKIISKLRCMHLSGFLVCFQAWFHLSKWENSTPIFIRMVGSSFINLFSKFWGFTRLRSWILTSCTVFCIISRPKTVTSNVTSKKQSAWMTAVNSKTQCSATSRNWSAPQQRQQSGLRWSTKARLSGRSWWTAQSRSTGGWTTSTMRNYDSMSHSELIN